MNPTKNLAIATVLLPCVATAGVWGDLSPSAFGGVEVVIGDSASDGCWTNLGESKTYAEDKLRNLGYVVSDGQEGTFAVSVISERQSTGKCYGSIRIQIYKGANVGGLWGFHEVADSNEVFVNYDNANTLVLNSIKNMIDDMSEAQN